MASRWGREATFRYMRWAKAQRDAPATYDLASSGLPPPGPDALDLHGVRPSLSVDEGERARARVAAYWEAREPEVMLTLGTSHAAWLACAVMLQAGDRCLVESPCYEQLSGLPGLFGAEVSPIPRRFEAAHGLPRGLAGRVRAVRPRLVLLSNPHNPSGRLLTRSDLEPVAEACAAVGSLLFVDEVYLPFLADPAAHSAFDLPATAIGASLTKAFGLGALRFGWLAGPEDVIEAAVRYDDFCVVNPPSPSASVALAALERLEPLRARAEAARETGLERVRAWVAGREDLSWHEPDVGIVCFPRVLGSGDTRRLCDDLRREQDTLVVPGTFFGAPSHLRLGFGAPAEVLDEGLRRLGYALDASYS